MANLQSVNVSGSARIDANGIYAPTSASNPSSPITGQIYYNTTANELRQWNGQYWQQVAIGDGGFKYRQVITTSYVMGGYKDNSPWTNVNRMVHSTDVCTNLGDQLAFTASYSSAGTGPTKGWMFAAANAHSTATTQCCAFNLATETGIAANSNNYHSRAFNDAGTAWKELEYCHILGESTTDKFNMTTETSTASGLSLIANGTGGGVQGIVDEYHALLYNDGSGQKLHFTTDMTSVDRVDSNNVAVYGVHNQQKSLSSKLRKGYGGNEGTYNGGYNYRRWDMVTNTQMGTVTKPMGNIGEENYDMGQDHQYCMGNYDGAQNNRGHKFFYATDYGYELGAGSLRTGVPGGSSGGCVWKG